ncbi:hypothetical protein [Desulfobacterium sp. N47]|uniref:Uncharacterized protein n=1 Tax=uncultured Desulfobacterium sp. TaxID=201089 RepID=E1YAH9_9BACT|nr:unknown protein [uncultured Desulfobacterium sp.]
MLKIIILLITAFVIFIIVRNPGSQKTGEQETEAKKKAITYVCTECGEKNCNCYKEDAAHKH